MDTTAVESRIVIQDVSKVFTDDKGVSRPALSGVSLAVRPGEFTVLLGPSGCGKTTLLRCVAGLETPTQGTIELSGRAVFSDARKVMVPTERRDLSMVFQSYALWPHMTILDNVAFPLKSKKASTAQARERSREMLDLVGLAERVNAHPSQLSGGQQQRVALARAIVSNSDVVLFDEPLSNLDAKVRERLRVEVVNLQRQIGFSALYVTHDQSEAMSMADTVVVMNNGTIEQIGSPADVYVKPSSRYVANFVGNINEIVGEVASVDGDTVVVDTRMGRIVASNHTGDSIGIAEEVIVGIRPEHLTLTPGVEDVPNSVEGTITRVAFMGGSVEYDVEVAGQSVMVRTMPTEVMSEGTVVRVVWGDLVSVFPASTASGVTAALETVAAR